MIRKIIAYQKLISSVQSVSRGRGIKMFVFILLFMIANTIKCNFGDGAVLNGDIMGQVGKCSLHRDIPEIFATPSYFRCKLHNHVFGRTKNIVRIAHFDFIIHGFVILQSNVFHADSLIIGVKIPFFKFFV